MRLSFVLRFLGIFVVVVVCLFAADVGAKKGAKDKDKKNRNKAPCKLSAAEMEQSFRVQCPKKSFISSISVVGHKDGTPCQGLPADLLVQVNLCFWKNSCTLTYNTTALNYMLKLYRGNMFDCVTQQPDRFVISYECTHPRKVKQMHVIQKKKQEGKGEEEEEEGDVETKDKEGIMVSHADHPWLYQRQRFQESHLKERLTLTRPKKRQKTLTYTIRTLNLMKGDNLTVKWTADRKNWKERAFSADHPLTSADHRNHFVSDVQQVVFSLDTAHFTNGGEGFVICFKWVSRVRKGKRAPDVCKRLLRKGQGCGEKEKGGKKQAKSKKGGKQ